VNEYFVILFNIQVLQGRVDLYNNIFEVTRWGGKLRNSIYRRSVWNAEV